MRRWDVLKYVDYGPDRVTQRNLAYGVGHEPCAIVAKLQVCYVECQNKRRVKVDLDVGVAALWDAVVSWLRFLNDTAAKT